MPSLLLARLEFVMFLGLLTLKIYMEPSKPPIV